jgi:hypothetical protein
MRLLQQITRAAPEAFTSACVNVNLTLPVLPSTDINKQQAQYAALVEKVVACVCVCECELEATGVALSQTDKHNMRHYSSRKRVLTRERCLSAENIRNAVLARQT